MIRFCIPDFEFSIRRSKKTYALLASLYAMLFVFSYPVSAQQPAKLPRIGILIGSSLSANAARIEAFRQGLRELGYVEGKNFVFEFRSAEGKTDRLPEVAAELVRLKVDVIVTTGPVVNPAAKQATSTIPIVMGFDYDPVGNGLVASLARPGGNTTGLSSQAPEITGKQLEFLKEIVPRLSRVTVLGSSKEPAHQQLLTAAEIAARTFKMTLQYVDILSPNDIEGAFGAVSNGRAEALLMLGAFIFNPHRARIARLAAGHRLPAIYNAIEWVEAGGLMSYGTSFPDLFRRAATFVDKILKGAKPADLPVEQPRKFELVINLKSAKQIGLAIPANVLTRADKILR